MDHDQSWMTVGEGSEAELRPNEKVCPETGYTYNAALPSSPHTAEGFARGLTPAQLAHLRS
jgi:hypothetical protein